MKALVARDTDGWSTRGLVARLDNGQIVMAANVIELIQELRAIGVDAIEVSGPEDGDRALSATVRESLLEAWLRVPEETEHPCR